MFGLILGSITTDCREYTTHVCLGRSRSTKAINPFLIQLKIEPSPFSATKTSYAQTLFGLTPFSKVIINRRTFDIWILKNKNILALEQNFKPFVDQFLSHLFLIKNLKTVTDWLNNLLRATMVHLLFLFRPDISKHF